MSLYPQHASLPLEQLPAPELEQPSPLMYGGPDDEAFSAKSPEEYLLELFEDVHHTALVETIRARGDLEIVAYRRRQLEPEQVRWWADDAWETFVERFEEELGGDDSCYRPMKGDGNEALREARQLLVPIFERLARKYLVVWQCEEVSRRTWTVDEVLRAVAPPPRHHVVVPVHRFERGAP